MSLSYAWRTVLTRLSTYGEDGIDKQLFTKLLSDDDASYRNGAEAALSQMYFLNVGYYERHPNNNEKIRITKAGLEELSK